MSFRFDIFWRSACGQCPDCAKPLRFSPDASVFERLSNIPSRCANCGLVLRRKEGFFLGAMVWNYGLIAFGILPVLLLCLSKEWLTIGSTVKIAVGVVLLLPPFIHALAWRFWLGTYYGFLPDQLPSQGRRVDD